ncbi:MAG: asparagine synthase (glutamine-hydrolyzing) [Gammaproteobacteria bacterium]
MCGICGIVTTHRNGSPEREVIEKMRDTMLHRGPDGSGIYVAPGVGLGHRRLSIIDIAHGQQPMHSDNRRFVITYNGEVFNHASLTRQLEAAGAKYKTHCDTETVLHLFERYRAAAVEQMRGMFAFAVWDTQERTLFLARDRFGVKPLYYVHRSDGTLLFASEIKALLAASSERPRLNLNALPDFLANHAPSGEDTLFVGVHRLPPGHSLIWQNGKITIRRYWDLSFDATMRTPARGSRAETALVEEFRERFTEAVRIRLMSDVPLGVFLSGGIDSAAITATMAKLVDAPIRTFSVAFAERDANELAYARVVAAQYRTEHREVVVDPSQFFGELPNAIWHEDEPLAHPSSVALYFVSRLAAEHVKVVLTGEGSDEMLAGYNRYRVTQYNLRLGVAYQKLLPKFAREGVRSAVAALPLRSRIRQRAQRTFLTRGSNLDDLYFDNFAVFDRDAQRAILREDIRAHVEMVDPYAAHHAAMARLQHKSVLSQLLYTDSKTYLAELLMKQDQMSMAASIESRVPFLDHPLAEWTASLPDSMKLRGTTTKWILRRAMNGILPASILKRRKMGFPVPINAWLRGAWRPLLDEYASGPRARQRGIFDGAAVETLRREHESGVNHGERLWALITFELWARMFLDGEAPDTLRLTV